MSVDTIAIIRKETTLIEIFDYLKQTYENVEIKESTYMDKFGCFYFNDNKDTRTMYYSLDYDDIEKIYGICGIKLSLGFWGNSFEIMKNLCNTFGGFVDENDCDENDFVPFKLEKFYMEGESNKIDLFKIKIIQTLGYKNLNKTLELFHEFKVLENSVNV